MTKEEQERRNKEILGRYLPSSAVEPIFLFLDSNKVHFHITRKRTSKLGDYRMPQPRHPFEEISVNGDLSPHMFLLVLLHEMAHLLTHQQFGNSVQAHGHEWQNEYRKLLINYFNNGHFPEETRNLFSKYTSKIPLNRSIGQELERQLKQLDNPDQTTPETILKELPVGTVFIINNGPKMVMRLIEKIRTRYKCMDEFSHKMYSVSGNASVTVVSDELLQEAKSLQQ